MTPEKNERRYLSLDGFAELVKSVKDPAAIDTSKIALVSPVPVEVKALGGEDSRLIEFIITTERVDRDQDIISADGWDFEDYRKNPVVLWCHDHYSLPIGNSRSLTVGEKNVKSICEFTPEDLNPFGYMAYRLYAKGFLHAVSVGFFPKEYTMAADRKYGINYVKQGLLEYSGCPVPANPDALAVARSKGINLAPLKQWAETVLDEKKGLSDDARHRIEIVRAVSAPNGRALILDLGDTKMGKEETAQPSTPATTVKRVERWDCGTTGHAHESEGEAKSCAEFDAHVIDVIKTLQGMQGLIKSGKAIKPESGALIRSIVDELLPVKQEEAASQNADEPETLEVDEESLTASIERSVEAVIGKAMGRVD